jgi:hypothetical protein
MTYGARQFAAFVTTALVATAAFLGAILYGVEPRLADPAALHAFLFERTPIQWCTLAVFFFVVSVLVHRVVQQRQIRAQLARLESGRPPRHGVVAERLQVLSACKRTRGADGAPALRRELGARDEEQLGRTYGLLQNAVQLMLALGFLGTVWGISRSLFDSFLLLSGAETDQLRAGQQGFAGAMATALDTSVLGLVTSLLATILMAGIQWGEASVHGQLDDLVGEALALNGVTGNAAPAPARLEEELSGLSQALAAATSRAAAAYEARLAQALEHHLARLDERERRAAEHLSEAIARSLSAPLHVLHDIARGLQRVPEVSIRYPAANGRAATQPAQE